MAGDSLAGLPPLLAPALLLSQADEMDAARHGGRVRVREANLGRGALAAKTAGWRRAQSPGECIRADWGEGGGGVGGERGYGRALSNISHTTCDFSSGVAADGRKALGRVSGDYVINKSALGFRLCGRHLGSPCIHLLSRPLASTYLRQGHS